MTWVCSSRAPLPVGVLDAQDVGAAGMAGKEPVEQGSAGAADVEVSGRGRGEADARFGHEGLSKSVNSER